MPLLVEIEELELAAVGVVSRRAEDVLEAVVEAEKLVGDAIGPVKVGLGVLVSRMRSMQALPAMAPTTTDMQSSTRPRTKKSGIERCSAGVKVSADAQIGCVPAEHSIYQSEGCVDLVDCRRYLNPHQRSQLSPFFCDGIQELNKLAVL